MYEVYEGRGSYGVTKNKKRTGYGKAKRSTKCFILVYLDTCRSQTRIYRQVTILRMLKKEFSARIEVPGCKNSRANFQGQPVCDIDLRCRLNHDENIVAAYGSKTAVFKNFTDFWRYVEIIKCKCNVSCPKLKVRCKNQPTKILKLTE